jgi:hypothetical protein
MSIHRIVPRSGASNVPSHRFSLRKVWRRGLNLLGSIGLGWAAATVPTSATAAELQVPQHWLSYAQLVSNQFQGWLSDAKNDSVVRLHTYMQDRMLQEGASPPRPLVVRVWVAQSGRVERLEFSSLGSAQADADLRSLLTSQPLSEPPPPDMRQPMVLQLDLTFVTAV